MSALTLGKKTLAAGILAAGLATGPAAQAVIIFDFNFVGGPVGFLDPDPMVSGPRQQALIDAGNSFSTLFGTFFTDMGSIQMDVTSSDDPMDSTLASAGSELIDQSMGNGFNLGEVVRIELQTGTDINGTAADGSVNVNWGQPWGLDPMNVGAGEFDFFSTMYHEFLHALGFLNTQDQGGNPVVGTTAGGSWGNFDRFITDVNGNPIIDPTTFALDQTNWDANSIGGPSPGAGLFFNGPNAVAANGGNPVGLFTPNPYQDGSSVGHLDDENPALAGLLMLAATDMGPSAQSFDPIEVGILQDIGYTRVGDPPVQMPVSSTLFLLTGGLLGLLGFRRRP